MRISHLRITNFRAIENFEIESPNDFIVIAGPNGCGKTTVLDSIRLLKSMYVREEWKRWFNEFGINVDRPTNFHTLFRNPDQPALISAKIALSESECEFLDSKSMEICYALRLAESVNRTATITGEMPLEAPDLPDDELNALRAEATTLAEELRRLVSTNEFSASVQLTNQPRINLTPSLVATAAFSCFDPDNLGEVEFHGSRRVYMRESVSNIRLKVADRTEERRSRFLYDWENKYKNIKTQLGEEYVSSILRQVDPETAPLQSSIKELFRAFFPGKEFLGVSLAEDNSLAFPVRLDTGEEHDIDELSSGEKEIVYGYLWLRTGTPKQSVVLVDEPELHLNPALVQGLPSFYKTHLADALDAQVWIVTHSDAILRQAVRAADMSVFHMARPSGGGEKQALHIDSQDEVEAAVLDLIGDLAAYRPYAKIVLVEGQKETRFDVDMIRRLFPDFTEKANFIPVGNRRMTTGVRVRLLEVLAEAGLTKRAVSISDGDLGQFDDEDAGEHFTWPVYEIENFLLDSMILRSAAASMLRNDPFPSDQAVIEKLRSLADPLVRDLACMEVQRKMNSEFIKAIAIGGGKETPVDDLVSSSAASRQRITELDTSNERVGKLFDAAVAELQQHITDDSFLQKFPGDRLLRAFAGEFGLTADHFKNTCLDQAQKSGYRPAEMEATISRAIAS